MKSNEVNSFRVPVSLHSQLQEIAGEIAHSPISQQKYQHLSKRLDKTLQDLETRSKTENLFIKAQANTLKEQVVQLYGDLEKGLVKEEVSQIKEESTSLRKGRLTRKAIQKLEAHIRELESNHLPTIPDRRVVAEAKQALLEAKAKLEGKPQQNHFKFLASQKNVQFVEEAEIASGDIEELFDIARAVYNRDLRQAKARYAGLPQKHKEMVEGHIRNHMADLFEDQLETMQSLIAAANELVNNGQTYPSSAEIDQLFLGLAQLIAEENNGSKIVKLFE